MSVIAEEAEENHNIKNLNQYNYLMICKNKFFEKGKKKSEMNTSLQLKSPIITSKKDTNKSNRIISPIK